MAGTKYRTTQQIAEELEKERLERFRRKQQDQVKREQFIIDNKDKKYFCKKCNEEKSVEDYSVTFRREDGSTRLACKECKRRKNRELALQRRIEKGY